MARTPLRGSLEAGRRDSDEPTGKRDDTLWNMDLPRPIWS